MSQRINVFWGAGLSMIALSHCARSPEAEIQAFRKAYDPTEAEWSEASVARAKVAAHAWDDVVVALLNSGKSPSVIGQILGSLPQSDEFDAAGASNRNPVAEWPDYELSYALFPLKVGRSNVWIGVANFGVGPTALGHLGVFSPVGRRWQRTDALDAENTVYGYPVPGLPVPTVVLIDHTPAADGWSGDLQILSVEDGRLKRHGSPRHLMFYDVERVANGPRILFSDYGKCLGLDVMHMHSDSRFELFVRAVGGAPGIEIQTASPWVAAVDEACVAVRAGKTPAIDDSRSMAATVRLFRHESVLLADAEGDPAAGTGRVTVFFFSPPGADQETYTRLDVRRGPGDSWRIVKVTEERER